MTHKKGAYALVAAVTLGIAGCSFNAGLNPTYFEYSPRAYDQKVAGVGAIEMPKSAQEEVFSGKPTSFTGGGTTLTMPIGAITREAANLAFKDVFSRGVKVVEPGATTPEYVAVVRPQVRTFTYEYNQLKNVGFAITPTAVISLSVSLTDAGGKTVWERQFDSGTFEGPAYFVSGSPGEEISKTTHKAMMKLMQDAADAVHKDLSANPPAPAKGETTL